MARLRHRAGAVRRSSGVSRKHIKSDLFAYVGRRFGRLVVVGFAERRPFLACRCDCGKARDVQPCNLTRNRAPTVDCGCSAAARDALVKHRGTPRPVTAGERYGRLVLLRPTSATPGGRKWAAQCDCGAETEILPANCRAGLTRSCGCLQREVASTRSTTHGLSDTPEHCVWAGMLTRCKDPSVHSWPRYGGRGIKVCERWQTFENFLTDMGPRPSDRHSIDRINNDGDYEPGNCRWVRQAVQARNTMRTAWITLEDVRLPACEVYPLFGISRQLFSLRVKQGWDMTRAATTRPDNAHHEEAVRGGRASAALRRLLSTPAGLRGAA